MAKIILAINAGSSSVKVSVFSYESTTQDPHQLAEIQISGLTAPPAKLKYSCGDHHISDQEVPDVDSQESAYNYIIKHLTEDPGLTELQHRNDIEFACHRVVHGGDYDRPTRIDKDTYHHLEKLSDLAPLHNAGALTIVRAVHANNPKVSNIAFFDSAFHATIPKHITTYPINPSIASRNKLRKYGFHGISYQFLTRTVSSYLSVPSSSLNIIALHLGSGASICAIQNGSSLDTSMGLTPLAGLPGATRSGDVDPSLIFHFTHDAGKLSPQSTKDMSITQAEEILNKESGWKVLTGTTDFGVISQKAEAFVANGRKEDDDEEEGKQCRLAFDIFVDRIIGYIGAYYVRLEGKVDALVFAGGIGEKGVELRKAVAERVKCLGFEIDSTRNEEGRDEVVVDVGRKESRHRVLVVKTDEQKEMARECVRLAGELRKNKE